MKLSEGKVGLEYRVISIDLPAEIEKRLQAIGMTKDTKIFIKNNKNHGTMVIDVRGTRFAIGKKISNQVKVSVIS